MPIPTPEQLRVALRPGGRAKDACAALGTTLAGIRCKRADGSLLHPELVAVLDEAAAARRRPRDAHRHQGEHRIALPPETVASLDVEARGRARRTTRSAIARERITAALARPLPAPLPGDRALPVKLDLGAAWEALGAKLDTDDPETIAGHVRAILARGKKSTGAPKKV